MWLRTAVRTATAQVVSWELFGTPIFIAVIQQLCYSQAAPVWYHYHCELEAMKYLILKSYSNNSCSSEDIAIINNGQKTSEVTARNTSNRKYIQF